MTVVEQSSPVQPVETKMVSLGDIAKFINGAAFKPTDWNAEGARIIRIQNLNDPKKPYNRTTRIVGPQFHVSPGDLLVSWSASLGVFVWDQPDVGLLNQHIFRVIPDHGLVTADYLRHMLVGALADMEAHLHGATMKHVNRKEFLAVRIPLPPLPEQRRISAILDKADHLRTQRREAVTHLDALTQSIFHSMFAGLDLLPSKQPLSSLIPPGDRINYGVVQPGDDLQGGIPLIRVGDLKNGLVSSSNIKHIAPEIESQYARSRINGTEILVSCVGTIGEIAITRPTEIGMNVARAVARVPIAEHDKRIFVAEYLRTEEVQRYFTSELRTVSQPTLNIRQILETPISVPPLELLQIFARRVAGVERLKEQHRTQLAELDALFASLQHRAFRGES